MPDAYHDPTFAARYETDNPGLDGDVAFYAALAREAASKRQEVLELGCGTGRVTIPIAREGVRITGLERAPAMLDIARERGAGIEGLTWVEGDMARFDLGRRFGLVIIPYRSFLHLTSVEEQRGCLECVRRHLLPDGRLALNFFNPDVARLAESMSQGRSSTRSRGLSGTSRTHPDMAMRYVSRSDFEALLTETGFEVEALYGWFDGASFSASSTEMVWLARASRF